jgi:hypothetical protein
MLWRSLHPHQERANHEVRNGNRTLFWLDWWCGKAPLRDHFPRLFAICDNQMVSVSTVCSAPSPHIRLRRTLDHQGVAEWNSLASLLAEVVLSDCLEKVSWSLEAHGQFSVSSMYDKLSRGTTVADFKDI